MTISGIIPYYNAADTLERAVESVMAQEYPVCELILVDNNSTDNSLQIAEALAAKYSNIRLTQEHTQGANYARNLGASVAKGEWLQFLDADDELLPGKLSHQVRLIGASLTKPVLVCAAARIHVINNKGAHHSYTKPVPEDINTALIKGLAGLTCSNLWNKTSFDYTGGWNTQYRYIDDPMLVFSYAKLNKPIIIDNKALTVVHQDLNKDSTSRPHSLKKSEEMLREISEYYKQVSQYLKLQYPNRKDYLPLIKIQQTLTYYNYKLLFGQLMRKPILHFKNENEIQPDLLTKMRAYYYYLINNKVNSSGVMKYPKLLWQAVVNSYKLLQ